MAASLFAFAATTKILAIRLFRNELADYELLPSWLIAPVAVALPLAELAAAAAAFVPSTRIAGSFALLLLLCVFSIAIGINLGRGRTQIRCACFGEESQTLSWVSLFRNGMIVIPLLLAILLHAPTIHFVTAAGSVGALLYVTLGWLLLEAARHAEIVRPKEAIR